MARLTDIGINALPPPLKGQKTYFDETLSGFGVRVSQGGTGSFILQHGADRQLTTIGRYPIIKLAQARTEAKRLLAERTLGKHRPQSIPFDEAKDLFLDHIKRKNKPRTLYDYTRLFKRHFTFAKRQIADITPSDINRKLDRLSDTSAEQRYALVLARTFFKWCVRRHYLNTSPCERMTPPKLSTPRTRVLSDDEIKSIWQATEQTTPFNKIVRLLLLTGQRRGEIASLQKSWIQDKQITFPLEITKNGREHILPISPLVISILSTAQAASHSGLLFPARGSTTFSFNGWSKSKAALDKFCGVTGWTLHDLRRTFSTRMAEHGTPPHIIERLLNHVSGTISGVAAVYNRAKYMEEMRVAMLA